MERAGAGGSCVVATRARSIGESSVAAALEYETSSQSLKAVRALPSSSFLTQSMHACTQCVEQEKFLHVSPAGRSPTSL